MALWQCCLFNRLLTGDSCSSSTLSLFVLFSLKDHCSWTARGALSKWLQQKGVWLHQTFLSGCEVTGECGASPARLTKQSWVLRGPDQALCHVPCWCLTGVFCLAICKTFGHLGLQKNLGDPTRNTPTPFWFPVYSYVLGCVSKPV